MNYLGIDLGKKGAIALIDDQERIVDMYKMPLVKKAYNPMELNRIINHCKEFSEKKEIQIIIERPLVSFAMKRSTKSIASLNYCFGLIEGICTANRLPYEVVSPQRWQNSILKDIADADTKKEKALLFAQRKFNLNLKKSEDGLADALCIALWGIRNKKTYK